MNQRKLGKEGGRSKKKALGNGRLRAKRPFGHPKRPFPIKWPFGHLGHLASFPISFDPLTPFDSLTDPEAPEAILKSINLLNL